MPLIDHGHLHYGENKVQEAKFKWTSIKNEKPNLNLHFVGKLQTNKAKDVVKLFDYVHSLENIKQAELLSKYEKELLENALWTQGKLNRNLIAKSAKKIANEIKLNLNSKDDVKFLMVEENGIGTHHLFSGEKLSPVLTVYKADDFNHAKSISNEMG